MDPNQQRPQPTGGSLPVPSGGQQAAVAPVPTQPAAAPLHGAPAEAQDMDVIEKEWVRKAKQIVGTTRDDPYTQLLELNKLRADYLKKRYNKEIKLPEF